MNTNGSTPVISPATHQTGKSHGNQCSARRPLLLQWATTCRISQRTAVANKPRLPLQQQQAVHELERPTGIRRSVSLTSILDPASSSAEKRGPLSTVTKIRARTGRRRGASALRTPLPEVRVPVGIGLGRGVPALRSRSSCCGRVQCSSLCLCCCLSRSFKPNRTGKSFSSSSSYECSSSLLGINSAIQIDRTAAVAPSSR